MSLTQLTGLTAAFMECHGKKYESRLERWDVKETWWDTLFLLLTPFPHPLFYFYCVLVMSFLFCFPLSVTDLHCHCSKPYFCKSQHSPIFLWAPYPNYHIYRSSLTINFAALPSLILHRLPKPGSWDLIFSLVTFAPSKSDHQMFLHFFSFGWEMRLHPLHFLELSLSQPTAVLNLEARLLFVQKPLYPLLIPQPLQEKKKSN